jgi:protein ImuB
LRARRGPEAVYGLCLVDEHRPERAWRAAEPGAEHGLAAAGRGPGAAANRPGALPEAADSLSGAAGPDPGGARRPLWLLRPPQPLGQGPPQALQLLDGPERIESGWWDGHDVARDYYTARDAGGALLWVFRERQPPHRWFLHGVFG